MNLKSIVSRLKNVLYPVDLAVFHEFMPSPYGGGNQFMKALCSWISRQGYRIEMNRLTLNTKACLYNSFNFNYNYLKFRKRESCTMVHRVDGPIASYRGYDDGTDSMILKYNNELADRTIFQSDYSYKKHIDLGYTFVEPSVIMNAVNSDIFNPNGRVAKIGDVKIKIISASWSTNENKGFQTYKWLGENLDPSRYEYTFVGRTPYKLPGVVCLEACASEDLAVVLKQHHIYLSASENDPCSNSLIEALSCGLPAIYLKSGGHPEIVKNAGLGFDDKEEIPKILEELIQNYSNYQKDIFVENMNEIGQKYLQILGLSHTDF